MYCGINNFLNNFGCFEILVCNFLIDDELNPWLTSAKRNPFFTCKTKAEKEIIPELIRNVNFSNNY
jgi:hypothetical protein